MSSTPDVTKLNANDQVELRRFVGRELLLWMWMESELFEGTLETRKHGSFGLWLEGRLVLDEGRESTTIKGTAPGAHREAKEALLRGKTPDRVGLHVSFGDHDVTLTLRGETLAIAGLAPPRANKEEGESISAGPAATAKSANGKNKGQKASALDAHDAFYDRMHFARDVEELVEALYQDFLTLRLSATWERSVVPALEAWVAGKAQDPERYRSARARALT
jgi:hypothetical protein